MQFGDKVTIYEDPVTCKKPEGKATLLQLLIPADPDSEPKMEYWQVQFKKDTEGDTYNRWIKTS